MSWGILNLPSHPLFHITFSHLIAWWIYLPVPYIYIADLMVSFITGSIHTIVWLGFVLCFRYYMIICWLFNIVIFVFNLLDILISLEFTICCPSKCIQRLTFNLSWIIIDNYRIHVVLFFIYPLFYFLSLWTCDLLVILYH